MCGEMPVGAEEEYRKLIDNPDRVENWPDQRHP
jgi:hypothetical protein